MKDYKTPEVEYVMLSESVFTTDNSSDCDCYGTHAADCEGDCSVDFKKVTRSVESSSSSESPKNKVGFDNLFFD